jgi:protein-L-isoaspartate(D-aspartate) O-methyltransferase
MVRALGPLPPEVAAAMGRVPRHRFVPPALEGEAYDDTPLPLGPPHSTISAPHMVAMQLEWAELRPGLRVLELGCGSGYLAALVAELVRPGGRVVGVEREPDLVASARDRMAELGYTGTVSVHLGDARAGAPADAPFDRILVSFATPEIFPEWTAQLATPGILVAPVGGSGGQALKRLRRERTGDRVEHGPAVIFVGIAPAGVRHK